MSQILESGQVVNTADKTIHQTRIPGLGKLEYSFNWNNKLDCLHYTTMRLENPGKYQVGRKFGVYLNGKHIHDAQVIEVKSLTINQITEWSARLDTGLSKAKCIDLLKTMYKNKQIDWTTQKLNWVLLEKL
ncbi:hypothetical protein HNV11_23760 (plasmid) [Spirosoma taeanense]|uniref:Uncharacterized protein n=1 Tax=Spirosoma taeanense TaxID=2735870 RepID=A0A6M5YGM1_9BACT|nr:hypothetical protein [Spirosoma taeanense]QJW92491.1 hypothetical protein HNV11_23760 [Spirosoma taeanense]